jgi:hypothetical protein
MIFVLNNSPDNTLSTIFAGELSVNERPLMALCRRIENVPKDGF